MAAAPPLLEARNISKQFAGVRALHDVSLTLDRGEVLAVVGENGAGKSTFMQIVAGVQSPDEGQLFIDGQAVRFTSVAQALDNGHLADPPGAQPGRQPLDRRQHFSRPRADALRPDRRAGDRRPSRASISAMVGLDVSPQTIVSTLSIGKQQLVEIAKALSTNARLLIMDEPTRRSPSTNRRRCSRSCASSRSQGVSILYISHRLHEVEQLADRVVVLRDGKFSGELSRDENQRKNMVRLMIGRDVSRFYHRTPHTPGDDVLSVQRPPHARRFRGTRSSFSLRAGEVVGLAGLVGAGRSELLTTLFGVTPAVAGSMTVGPLAAPAANIPRSDRRRHHARPGRSPPHRPRSCR